MPTHEALDDLDSMIVQELWVGVEGDGFYVTPRVLCPSYRRH